MGPKSSPQGSWQVRAMVAGSRGDGCGHFSGTARRRLGHAQLDWGLAWSGMGMGEEEVCGT